MQIKARTRLTPPLHSPVQRERGGWAGKGEEVWSLLFAGGEFADLAGCGHALAGGVGRGAGSPV